MLNLENLKWEILGLIIRTMESIHSYECVPVIPTVCHTLVTSDDNHSHQTLVQVARFLEFSVFLLFLLQTFLVGTELLLRFSTVEFGGEGEIRTHGRVAPSPVFKTGSFNRSDTSPQTVRRN